MASEPQSPPETDAGDPMSCSRCGAEVTGDDIEQGRAVCRDDRLLCPDCLEYLRQRRRERQKPSTAGEPVADTAGLDRLATEIHNLVRLLGSEKFSIWNILGGIAQAGALFAIVLAALDPANDIKLLWALLVQVMALSFFTAARK